jgi:hypothetical protein
MDFTGTETGRRALDFMRRYAEANAIEYSLDETHANCDLLIALWDAILEEECRDVPDAGRLREICISLVELSKLSFLQGNPQREPGAAEMEDYRRLFNHGNYLLGLKDVHLVKVWPEEFEFKLEITSDDDAVLRLQPGQQQPLFVKEEIQA